MSLRDTVEAEVREWYDAYVETFVGLARGERTDTGALLGFYGAPMVVVTDGDHKVRRPAPPPWSSRPARSTPWCGPAAPGRRSPA
ncbi:hypothetical protein [Streptomyces sp. NPDC088733]|uniref:DUF6841 family protein n=1 Tax=Streptomyces sp. NPDC088733 TaxID=3365880 RepID=UPI003822AE70